MRLRPGPRALWFLRHAQSEGNVLRDAAEAHGLERVELPTRDADVPLSDLGRGQAAAFGRWLSARPPQERPTLLVVSPYVRAQQSARLLLAAAGEGAGTPQVELDERLRDREIGLWEGLTWRGILARFPGEAQRARALGRYYHRPPAGESWADMLLRLRALLADLAAVAADERVLLVTHDIPIQLCRAAIEGMDEAEVVALVARNRYANCALTAFEADGAGYRLTAYNEVVPDEPAAAVTAPPSKEPDDRPDD